MPNRSSEIRFWHYDETRALVVSQTIENVVNETTNSVKMKRDL